MGLSTLGYFAAAQFGLGLFKNNYIYQKANRDAALDLRNRQNQAAINNAQLEVAELNYIKQESRIRKVDVTNLNLIRRAARSQAATQKAKFGSYGGTFGATGPRTDAVIRDIYRDASQIAANRNDNVKHRLDNLEQEKRNRRIRTFSTNNQLLAGAKAGGSLPAFWMNTASLAIETGLQFGGKHPTTGKIEFFSPFESS